MALHASPAGQSVLEEQPQEPLQAVPRGLPAQSAAAVHPQVFVEVLQRDPTGLAAQSAFATQPTHRPVAVLQAGPDVLPTQSEFDLQAGSGGSHKKGLPPLSPQISPDGQSAVVVQPHVPVCGASMGGGPDASQPGGSGPPPPVVFMHILPPPALAQSAIVEQPHVCGLKGPASLVLQIDPAGLAAQSAFVTQSTHRPVAVSHADPDVLPGQSALLVQAFEH